MEKDYNLPQIGGGVFMPQHHLHVTICLLSRNCMSNLLRVRLVGLRLQLWQLRLWFCWWSGFCNGVESVLENRLAKQLLPDV
jgi:hypothetical protein